MNRTAFQDLDGLAGLSLKYICESISYDKTKEGVWQKILISVLVFENYIQSGEFLVFKDSTHAQVESRQLYSTNSASFSREDFVPSSLSFRPIPIGILSNAMVTLVAFPIDSR